MSYQINLNSNNGVAEYNGNAISFVAERDDNDTRLSLSVWFPNWAQDSYVFLPACAYDGNKFEKIDVEYPPMYPKDHCKSNASPIISDVPALNPDGSGKIEVTTGDMSVPCVGVFLKNRKKAFFIFTEQACKGKNIGFWLKAEGLPYSFPRSAQNAIRCAVPMCRQTIAEFP